MDIKDYVDPLHYRFSQYVAFGFWHECWNWTGATGKAKHSPDYRWGVLNVRGKAIKASRLCWELNCGPIPDGMQVLHTCDNPLCVNLGHLYLGTPQDNVADMDHRGRRRTVVRFGANHPNAKISAEQVAIIRAHQGPARILAERLGFSEVHINAIRRKAQRKDD